MCLDVQGSHFQFRTVEAYEEIDIKNPWSPKLPLENSLIAMPEMSGLHGMFRVTHAQAVNKGTGMVEKKKLITTDVTTDLLMHHDRSVTITSSTETQSYHGRISPNEKIPVGSWTLIWRSDAPGPNKASPEFADATRSSGRQSIVITSARRRACVISQCCNRTGDGCCPITRLLDGKCLNEFQKNTQITDVTRHWTGSLSLLESLCGPGLQDNDDMKFQVRPYHVGEHNGLKLTAELSTWCGDNDNDVISIYVGTPSQLEPMRPYLPASPIFMPFVIRSNRRPGDCIYVDVLTQEQLLVAQLGQGSETMMNQGTGKRIPENLKVCWRAAL
jgi:hypothetical protein